MRREPASRTGLEMVKFEAAALFSIYKSGRSVWKAKVLLLRQTASIPQDAVRPTLTLEPKS